MSDIQKFSEDVPPDGLPASGKARHGLDDLLATPHRFEVSAGRGPVDLLGVRREVGDEHFLALCSMFNNISVLYCFKKFRVRIVSYALIIIIIY